MSTTSSSPFPAYQPSISSTAANDSIPSELVESGWAGFDDLNPKPPPPRNDEDCGPWYYAAYIGSTVRRHNTLPDSNGMIGYYAGNEWRFGVRASTHGTRFEAERLGQRPIHLEFDATLDHDNTAVISIIPVDSEGRVSNGEIADGLRIRVTPGSTVDIKCWAPNTRPDVGDAGWERVLPATDIDIGSKATVCLRSEGHVATYASEPVMSEIERIILPPEDDSLIEYCCSRLSRQIRPRAVSSQVNAEPV
jgi:hypothetical protein